MKAIPELRQLLETGDLNAAAAKAAEFHSKLRAAHAALEGQRSSELSTGESICETVHRACRIGTPKAVAAAIEFIDDQLPKLTIQPQDAHIRSSG